MVRSRPIRLKPNRTDTSWAEQYSVDAGAAVRDWATQPRSAWSRGPWRRLGSISVDPDSMGQWWIEAVAGTDLGDAGRRSWTFNEGLLELVAAWEARSADSPVQMQ